MGEGASTVVGKLPAGGLGSEASLGWVRGRGSGRAGRGGQAGMRALLAASGGHCVLCLVGLVVWHILHAPLAERDVEVGDAQAEARSGGGGAVHARHRLQAEPLQQHSAQPTILLQPG